MQEKYKVTALVSTYNSEQFIQGCLEDLIQQTIFDKTQVIIINSGSKQREEIVVKPFVKKYPNNIFYFSTINREGLYKAWNRGLMFAKGEYITNANTDDRHRKDAFEIMSNCLDENTDVGLVYADQRVTTISNSTFDNCKNYVVAKNKEFTDRNMIFKGCFTGSQPMWRASLHKNLGMFDENFVVAGDFEFWCRIVEKYKALHISEELGLYYRNEKGLELANKRICGLETCKIYNKYKNRFKV